jgi:hypothetical protein
MAYDREDAELYLDENNPSTDDDLLHRTEVLDMMVGYAHYAQEILTIDCARCGIQFRSVDNVKYCSKGCEMGYLPGTWWC